MPPETGSSGLAPALTKSFYKRVEMLGEDSLSESFLALEVVIKRPFWNTSCVSDVLDAARAESSFYEQLHGSVENGTTSVVASQKILLR